MKRCIAIMLAMTAAVLATAAPTKADKALVEKYKTVDFTPGAKEPYEQQGDFAYYSRDDGTQIWVADGYLFAQTPDQVTVDIQMEGGKEAFRTLRLPSGRECTIDSRKRVEWGVVMEAAPDFDLGVLGKSGKTVRLSDCRGKLVLLDFWASWCRPCMEGLPEKQAWYMKYKDDGLLVYGVNIEGDTAKAAAAAKLVKITFPVLMAEPDDSGQYNFNARQMKEYRIHGVPAMYLIGRDGIVLTTSVDETVIEEHLKR